MRTILWGFVIFGLLPLAAQTVKPFSLGAKQESINALCQLMSRFGYIDVDGEIDKDYHINKWEYKVKLNGVVIPFALDTGCDYTTLPPSLARKANLITENEKIEEITGAIISKKVNVHRVVAETFVIGPLMIRKTPIDVFRSSLSYGLLGMDFLRSACSLIDVRAARIYIGGRPGRKSEVNTFLRQQGYTRIPLSMSENGLMGVPVVIKGISGYMVLDTGAFATTVYRSFAKKAGLYQSLEKAESRDIHGAKDEIKSSMTDSFQVSGYSAPRTYVTVSNVDAPGRNPESFAGLLGIDFLHTNNAVIDLETRQLYVHP